MCTRKEHACSFAFWSLGDRRVWDRSRARHAEVDDLGVHAVRRHLDESGGEVAEEGYRDSNNKCEQAVMKVASTLLTSLITFATRRAEPNLRVVWWRAYGGGNIR